MSAKGRGRNTPAVKKEVMPPWDARKVRLLRKHMGLSQEELAGELGTRQQTISEWETGRYRPRGVSAKLLTIVAERAEFEYGQRGPENEKGEAERRMRGVDD